MSKISEMREKVIEKEKMKDESVVTVITPLGIEVGSFLWPTKSLSVLSKSNKEPSGNYFVVKNKVL